MLQGPEGTSSGVAVFLKCTRGRVKNFLKKNKKILKKVLTIKKICDNI